ncbi:MAG: toll/interleukin-1 receptor domain-containing protein [Pseudomonadota bacterium]
MRTIAFFSYTRADDEACQGLLSEIRGRLEHLLRAKTGEDVQVFQDVDDLKLGDDWRERLRTALDEAAFLVTAISPRFFNSPACREELGHFLKRSAELGGAPLLFPVLWQPVRRLNDPSAVAADPLLKFVEARQWADWTRHNVLTPADYPLPGGASLRQDLAGLADALTDAYEDARDAPAPSPSAAAPSDPSAPHEDLAAIVDAALGVAPTAPTPTPEPAPTIASPPPSGSLEARARALIAAKGDWFSDADEASREKFSGYFVKIGRSGFWVLGEFDAGDIVTGTKWDGSTQPMFRDVYAVRDGGGDGAPVEAWATAGNFAYLGAELPPDHQALAAEVRRLVLNG